MAVGDDFKVSRRYREDIAQLAKTWRSANPSWAEANRFDVVSLLVDHVLPELARQGRNISLTIVEDDFSFPDAWVNFGMGEICVQQWIWDAALEQEEHARLVIAHEIGHLILHHNQEFAFSRGLEKKLGFLDDTESAENQANWFASALLLPDSVLMRMSSLDDYSIATLALVGEQLVRVRRHEVSLDKRYRNYTGDQCSNCSGFNVSMRGKVLICDNCGELATL